MTYPLHHRAARLSVASVAVLALGLVAGGAPAVAAPAEEAALATVVSSSIDPTEVDVSDGEVDVTVTLELADNTDEGTPWILPAPPEDALGENQALIGFDMDLTEGDEVNGTWELEFTFDEESFEGDWEILAYGLTGDEDEEATELGTVSVTGSADGGSGGPGVIALPTDVPLGAWYFPSVLWMVAADITVGYTDGTFRPHNAVTRGEAVAFLYRWTGEDFEAPTTKRFDDVPTDHGFYEAISWAATSNVVKGYTDNKFRPGQGMTRGEVAAVLYRQAAPDYTAPAESELGDVVKGKTPHYDAINWLLSEEITSGRANGDFDPGARVTRAEFAAFLDRYDIVVNEGITAGEGAQTNAPHFATR